jgi:hypothetical protein
METFTTAAGSVALVKAAVDFTKYVRAKDPNGAITQLVVWLSGIAVTLLLRASDFAANFDVGGVPLASANTGTVILAGLGLGAAASALYDLQNAIDNTSSARKPQLIETTARDVTPDR